jgi:hypothetical protein
MGSTNGATAKGGTWPELHDYDLPEHPDWDRRAGEPARAYAAFRIYRDLPPAQRTIATVAEQVKGSVRSANRWAVDWRWRQRADAWDDACHRIDDQERLEAIRSMHSMHRRAGRAAIVKAVQALGLMEPHEMPPNLIARLLELGAKLERSTLLTSVEELQGIETAEDVEEDPWERIAAELDPRG